MGQRRAVVGDAGGVERGFVVCFCGFDCGGEVVVAGVCAGRGVGDHSCAVGVVCVGRGRDGDCLCCAPVGGGEGEGVLVDSDVRVAGFGEGYGDSLGWL